MDWKTSNVITYTKSFWKYEFTITQYTENQCKFKLYLFYNDYETSYTTYINHARWPWCLCYRWMPASGQFDPQSKVPVFFLIELDTLPLLLSTGWFKYKLYIFSFILNIFRNKITNAKSLLFTFHIRKYRICIIEVSTKSSVWIQKFQKLTVANILEIKLLAMMCFCSILVE